jgi:hypothetical protein
MAKWALRRVERISLVIAGIYISGVPISGHKKRKRRRVGFYLISIGTLSHAAIVLSEIAYGKSQVSTQQLMNLMWLAI